MFMVAFIHHAIGLQPRLEQAMRRCRPLVRSSWTARRAAFSSTALRASTEAVRSVHRSNGQKTSIGAGRVDANAIDSRAGLDDPMKSLIHNFGVGVGVGVSSSSSSNSSSSSSGGQQIETTDPAQNSKKAAKQPSKPLTISVHVDKDILSFLDLHQPQHSTRFQLSTAKHNWTVGRIRDMIEDRFPCLVKLPYKLRYSHDNLRKCDQPQLLSTTDELRSLFASMVGSDKALQLHVHPNPGLFPPNSGVNADPWEASSFTMVSFYTYSDISDPAALQAKLFGEWNRFNALGRVYVATEGVNAQMAIPSNVFSDFVAATRKISLFRDVRFNVDHEMPREEFAKQEPFSALHIRLRKQIVTDGLDCKLDLSQAGKELSPLEWHEKIADPSAVILDCRNTYETDIGKFQNAIPLSTHTFQGSWEAMQEILQGKPKDTPIYTYCTGGIRCVKINAYLQQNMGFVNTHRLQGGIIHYAKVLESQLANPVSDPEKGTDNTAATTEEKQHEAWNPQTDRNIDGSRFLGVNFVFDERLGARITKDVLAGCDLCGEPCDSFTNCLNPTCNVSSFPRTLENFLALIHTHPLVFRGNE